MGFGPLLGDDEEDFGHLILPFFRDVVDRVVDAVWELLDELVDGGLIEGHRFHGGTTVTQVIYVLTGAFKVQEPVRSLGWVFLEDCVSQAWGRPYLVQSEAQGGVCVAVCGLEILPCFFDVLNVGGWEALGSLLMVLIVTQTLQVQQ